MVEMKKPGGTTGLFRGRVMKKKVVCNIENTAERLHGGNIEHF